MSRHTAREQAFKFLYQMEIRQDDFESQLEGFLAIEPIRDPADLAYFQHLVQGVQSHRPVIDQVIGRYLRGWTMERQLSIDLSILRLGVFELLFDQEIPAEIAISEAVIFANEYGTDQSRAFINAVLGSVDKNEEKRFSSGAAGEDARL